MKKRNLNILYLVNSLIKDRTKVTKKEVLLKRLKYIEGKSEEQLEAIKNQGEKELNPIEKQDKNELETIEKNNKNKEETVEKK